MKNTQIEIDFPQPISKPFLKWAGGKTQLIDYISQALPSNVTELDTYIEPFVGSGAIMFWILNNYPNFKKVVVNDINSDLINTFNVIKFKVEQLIKELSKLKEQYASLSAEDRQTLFYDIRSEYNSRSMSNKISVRNATLFIFLNRTCFNGLYRVNSKNQFNVPFGKYSNPNICDADTLRSDSIVLQKVELLNGDYTEVLSYASDKTLIYFDPPYKPISETSSFNSYSKDCFDDAEQVRLKEFCDTLNERHINFMLSNSDPTSVDAENKFFDILYSAYNIRRVEAKRNINSKGNGRGKINELLITNY